MSTRSSLLHLMHLVSPALPVGAYAYSQGLEYAIDAGWLKSIEDISDWLSGGMEHGAGKLDLPVLIRCFRAWQGSDFEQVYYWNEQLQAWRETHELLLEDQQLGQALHRLLNSLEITSAWEELNHGKPSFVTMFALAGHHWNIPIEQLSLGFLYAWLENQVAAATKIMPLGQTQAQRLLLQLMPKINSICDSAFSLSDADVGYSLPGLAMSSALHERQYSRLFRS